MTTTNERELARNELEVGRPADYRSYGISRMEGTETGSVVYRVWARGNRSFDTLDAAFDYIDSLHD